jgi:hypothetical protein
MSWFEKRYAMRPEQDAIERALSASSDSECTDPASDNRALIAISHATRRCDRTVGYQHVPFLAQLVATKDQHPQTRKRRRAEPNVATAAYLATASLKAV